MRFAGTVAASAALALLATSPAAGAAPAQDRFVNSAIPLRIDHLIGFTPTYAGWLSPRFGPVRPQRVRLGGRTYRFTYSGAAAAIGPSVDPYVRKALRQRRHPSAEGFFFDRALRSSERSHLRVRLDLGRDADVLAVRRDHPACAGITREAARGIAAGRLRTWSAAGVTMPAGMDTIALRRAGSGGAAEPRFGASHREPAGGRLAADGGLREAVEDDGVAAVTSWSRARAFQMTTCAVPIGGQALDDERVRTLRHPDAYPIRYVTLGRLTRRGSPELPAIVQGWVDFLGGPRAAKQFGARGLLPAKGPWPAVMQGREPGPGPAPEPVPEPAPDPPAEQEQPR